MSRRVRRLFAVAAFAMLAALHAGKALAVVSCAVSSPGWTTVYDPLAATATITGSTVTVSCTRASGDPSSVNWSVALPTFKGEAFLVGGGAKLKYGYYRDPAISQKWDTASRLTGTLNMGTAMSGSMTVNFYTSIAARQNVPNGLYTDLDTMTLYIGGSSTPHSTGMLSTEINVGAACRISSAPGTVQLNYTSFQPTPATASTSFAVTCTSGMPYSMSLDATSGTLLGLAYSLALNPSTSQVGNGSPQPATITGTIASGQSGTCSQASCTASETRTLTVTY